MAALTLLLRVRGWEVTVAGPPGVCGGLGVDSVVLDVPNAMSPTALARAGVQLRRHARGHDLIHAHGLKAGWVALLGRSGRPVVLTVHNVVLDEVAGTGASLQRRLERALVRRVDHVIAASPGIVGHFDGVVPEGRISFILPVAAAAVPTVPRAEVRRSLGLGDDDVLVVVVARLHPQKDLAMFIDAWAEVVRRSPSARAAIVGDGPLRADLQAHIDRLGLAGSVTLAGPSGNAADEMAAADIVALTSRWEAVPLVAVEAVELGRPLVSTDVGIVAMMIADGAAGAVVEVGDTEGFARALSRYVESPRLRAAARVDDARSAGHYGKEALADAVASVYEKVLSS